jgi:hypothetical protein
MVDHIFACIERLLAVRGFLRMCLYRECGSVFCGKEGVPGKALCISGTGGHGGNSRKDSGGYQE